MFVLTTVVDRIRVPASQLALPTLTALHNEIDQKYPNRVLMNVGLVVCRYGDCLRITNGSCVPGDGGSHHECLFRLVVFRPFVEEVCLGKVIKATPDGIQVSLGNFFHDIFIPAYWMLRPSRYNDKLGLWVWSPDYGEEDGDNDEETGDGDGNVGDAANVKMEDSVKKENGSDDHDHDGNDHDRDTAMEEDNGEEKEEEKEGDGGEHFEMEIGAEIRFKIKSIHFTHVINTAKGVQATTTTTAHSRELPKENNSDDKKDQDGTGGGGGGGGAGGGTSTTSGSSNPRASMRKRSLSVEVSDMANLPASMNVVASICEDGLGLTSWWTSGGEDDDDGDDDGDEEEES